MKQLFCHCCGERIAADGVILTFWVHLETGDIRCRDGKARAVPAYDPWERLRRTVKEVDDGPSE